MAELFEVRRQCFFAFSIERPWHKANPFETLQREMNPQVGLAHGCNGMSAHGRMTIDPEHITIGPCGGKQITEQTMPPQIRLPTYDGNNFCCNGGCQYPDSFTDASNFR